MRAGVLVWCVAKRIEALLRTGPAAFFDVQLLPADGVVRDPASAGAFRERAGSRAPGVWLSAGGLRGDAEPCASVDQRAAKRNAFDGAADAETAGFAKDAQTQPAGRAGAIAAGVSEVCKRAAAVLAAKVLRFQCVQSQKEKGKAGVHARQSGGEKAGLASEGLALEQFRVLHQGRGGVGPDRCGEFVSVQRRREDQRENPRPQNPRTGHPHGTVSSGERLMTRLFMPPWLAEKKERSASTVRATRP